MDNIEQFNKLNFTCIDLREYKHVYLIGDMHGAMLSVVWEMTVRKKFKDTLVIACGDIGMGFESTKYYQQKWKRVIEDLKENHNHIACIRGNHDDPSYFRDGWFNHTIMEESFNNYITFVNDYNYLLTSIGGILCIGGAVSIDRSGYHRIKDQTWWMDEGLLMISDEEFTNILEIITTNDTIKNCPMVMVASHTSPRGAFPINNSFEDQGQAINNWAVNDSKLKEDCWQEREYLRHAQDILLAHPIISKTLKCWVYGHFHQHYEGGYDIYYVALDMFRHDSYVDALNDNQKRILSDWLDGKKLLKSLEE